MVVIRMRFFLILTLTVTLALALLAPAQAVNAAAKVPVLGDSVKQEASRKKVTRKSTCKKPAKKVASKKSARKAVSKKTASKKAAPKVAKNEPVVLGSRGDFGKAKRRPQGGQGVISSLVPKSLRVIPAQVSAKSVMVMDADTGKILFSRNAHKPRQPASTIKVLTGMIAIKSLKNSEKVNVSRHAANMPSSKVYLDQKKTYSADDLINAVLLASANDASVALAEKIAGSESRFADMMTHRAKLWGASTTVCKTATGLTAEGQYSTAADLASIFRYAMQDREFSRRMHRIQVNTTYGKTLHNHNKALWRIDGAVAGKTGYTIAARQTYVGQFERGDRSIIIAIMGSEMMWKDIERLVEYGFQHQEGRAADAGSGERMASLP